MTACWSILNPFTKAQDVKAAAARASEILRDPSIPVSSVGAWKVYIRRANMWFDLHKTKKKGVSSLFRCWWVSFILIHNTPKGLGVEMASCMVQDEQSLAKDARDSPLTPGLFLAAFCRAMEKFNSKPTGLVFWPALLGAFRAQSIHSLVEKLEPVIASECSLKCLPGLEPDQENLPNSCVKLRVRGIEDTEVTLFGGDDCNIPHFLESKLASVEAIADDKSRCRSAYVPCLTQNLELSIADLRRLFRASALYHDARPWELISNLNPIAVRVPDAIGGGPMKTLYVAVSGNGSWDARGLHFYKSMSDLKICGGGKKLGIEIEQIDLQYYKRTWAPFQTLTHIDELGLDMSINDGVDGERAYPCWFSSTTLPCERHDIPDCVLTMHNAPPKLEDIPTVTLVTMAIAKLVTDPRRLIYATENERGRPTTVVPVGEVPIVVDFSDEGKGGVVVYLELLQLPAKDFQADMDLYMETMSIGDMKMCNFCQKPKSLIKGDGEQLRACSICMQIEYCSKQCQANDWKRHKKDCRPAKK